MIEADILASLSDDLLAELEAIMNLQAADSLSRKDFYVAFGADLGDGLFRALEKLAQEGWSRIQVRTMLSLMQAKGRNQNSKLSWVLTGAVDDAVLARDTAVVFRSLIDSAEEEILIVSYALYNGKELLRPLAQKLKDIPGFRVRLIMDISRGRNDTSLDSEIIERFKREFRKYNWPDPPYPEVFFDVRGLASEQEKKAVIHAKCVIADARKALVTSANITEAAQEKNIEVGILVEDGQKVGQLIDYFDSMCRTKLEKVMI